MKAGDFSTEPVRIRRSSRDGCKGPQAAASLISRQKLASVSFAPSRPPTVRPYAMTAAFMAPALVAQIPSNEIRSSSSRRSRTPHVKAPCAPPPCKARLTVLAVVGIRAWSRSGRRAHDVGLQHRIHHAVGGRRDTEPAAELDDLAAKPGEFEPVAALEIERHRRFHGGRSVVEKVKSPLEG